MSQLEYQSAFPPGSFFHNNNALASQGQYPGQQQKIFHGAQQQQQQQQQGQASQQLHLQHQHQHQHHQQPQQQSQQRPQSIGPDGMHNIQSAGYLTTAPYSQSIPTGTVVAAQQQQAALRHSASPHQPNSPFNAGTPQPPQQIKYPMAAPPLPHTPINTQQFTSLTNSAPSTPQSPNTQNLEQSRIKLLFEINVDLIQEISTLQAQGKGGATNAQHQAQMKSLNMDDKMASEEYIQTMRRVQANLAWLAPRGNLTGSAQKPLPGPAHMTPPFQMPQLQAKYDRLKELCPGWAGYDQVQQSGSTPRANPAVNMNGMTA